MRNKKKRKKTNGVRERMMIFLPDNVELVLESTIPVGLKN